MKIASFFAGCGGLDLGFKQAGYDIIWANEYDRTIHETYQFNHPETILCKSDIRSLTADDIPDCDGFVGGPPCQAWSEGGKQLGLYDERGRLFLDYIRLIKEKRPKFFLIENVPGIIDTRNFRVFISFLSTLEETGYTVNYALLNAADYNIPQDRHRVFIVGFTKELNCSFKFPEPSPAPHIPLIKAIGDITDKPLMYSKGPVSREETGKWFNHDVYSGPWDTKFMARNRVRSWYETSFTIQALAKNTPLHPQAPKMTFVSHNRRVFKPGHEHLYRRLSVRECARIQTFPDKFRFFYDDIRDGYKMVGNAVPPRLAKALAVAIKEALGNSMNIGDYFNILVGYYKDEHQFRMTLKNKLYYVRAGLRRGALKIPIGTKYPLFLLLHNGKRKFLFKLVQEKPEYMCANDLIELGFAPKGKEYFAFRLESSSPVNNVNFDISDLLEKDKEGKKTFPHILSVPN